MRTLNEGREITLAMADDVQQRAARDGARPRGDRTGGLRGFRLAASATDWWLGSDVDSPRRMPREKFVEHLTTIMMGVIDGTAELIGIKLDPDQPIHNAMPHDSAAS